MDMEIWGRVFVTMFAAMNVVPVLPLALSMADDSDAERAPVLLRNALLVGVSAGALLAVVGEPFFGALGITLSDVRVAGGLVLLVFAVYDLLFSTSQRREDARPSDDHDIGIVPLGIPILVGPAGLTVLLVSSHAAGLAVTLTSLAVVTTLNLGFLAAGQALVRVVGRPTLKVVGKVMALVLAALAVSMIRVGLVEAITSGGDATAIALPPL